MKRPHTICHMLTSVDGKIMGKWMDTTVDDAASKAFYGLILGKGRFYEVNAILCGRITTDDNYTGHKTPELPDTAEDLPQDYVAPGAKDAYLYVNIDSAGKCAWDSGTFDMEGTAFHVVEVITNEADPRYKAYLKERGISYINGGDDAMELPMVMEKLADLFDVRTLMIGGGGILNWSCIQYGLCDEVSIVIAPAADGSTETQSVFMAKSPFTQDLPVVFNLLGARPLDHENSIVWLRYQCLNVVP